MVIVSWPSGVAGDALRVSWVVEDDEDGTSRVVGLSETRVVFPVWNGRVAFRVTIPLKLAMEETIMVSEIL